MDNRTMDNRTKVALIYGSTREGRFCDTVMKWIVAEMADRHEFAIDLIDPARLDIASAKSGAREELARRIGAADAFVVVTPEYNHGYPAPLKSLIDAVYDGWRAKPVAFVSYGGASGGLRAVEQLRLVFAELHAVTLRDGVSFANAWERFDAEGKPVDAVRAHKALATLLAQLEWWAIALRNARQAAPYAEAL